MGRTRCYGVGQGFSQSTIGTGHVHVAGVVAGPVSPCENDQGKSFRTRQRRHGTRQKALHLRIVSGVGMVLFAQWK